MTHRRPAIQYIAQRGQRLVPQIGIHHSKPGTMILLSRHHASKMQRVEIRADVKAVHTLMTFQGPHQRQLKGSAATSHSTMIANKTGTRPRRGRQCCGSSRSSAEGDGSHAGQGLRRASIADITSAALASVNSARPSGPRRGPSRDPILRRDGGMPGPGAFTRVADWQRSHPRDLPPIRTALRYRNFWK